MSPRVREFIKEDALSVFKMISSFSESWGYEALSQSIENEHLKSFVLEEENFIIGFCSFLVFEDAELVYMAIDIDMQGRGYGYMLITRVMNILQISQAILEVRSENISARKLYEKLGFENIGVRKGFYINPPDDGIVMRLT